MGRRSWCIGWLGALLLPAWLVAADDGNVKKPAAPTRAPELWAIVVGVDDYDDPAIGDLQTSSRQTTAMLQWLRATAGWNRAHLLLLSDLGAHDPGSAEKPATNILPTRKNLDWAFKVWLKPKAQSGDLIVFYFAGKAKGLAQPEGEFNEPVPHYYLLPRDANPTSLKATGWELDEALDDFAVQGKFQIVCWLGTSLPPRNPAAKPGGDGARPTGAGFLRGLTRWPGVSAWLAADEAAPDLLGEAADRFQAALLKGLGTPERRNNLAACLQQLRERPDLAKQGFAAVGGVPPETTLWSQDFGQVQAPERPEMVLQVGHADRITGIVSAADNRKMMTSSGDSTVRVWSLADRALLRVLTGPMVQSSNLALSLDGHWLVSSDGLNRIFVHEVAREFAPRPIAQQLHRKPVTQILMLADGDHFVSIDQDARSYRWDLKRKPMVPEPWLKGVGCLEAARGAGVVAASCDDGQIRVFRADGTAGAPQAPRPGAGAGVGLPTALAVAPDGRTLALGYKDGRLIVRDTATRKLTEYAVAAGPIDRLAFSTTALLAVGHEQGARVLALSDLGKPGTDFLDRAPGRLVFSGDGRYLAACVANTGELRVWRLDGAEPTRPILADDKANAYSLAFSGDDRAVIAGGFDGTVRVIALGPDDPARNWNIAANRGKIHQLSAAPSREHLLLVTESRQARIWDLKERFSRGLPGTWTSGVYVKDPVSRAGNLILSAPDEGENHGEVVLVDQAKFARLGEFSRTAGVFKVPEGMVFENLTLSPDGTRVAASADPAQVPLVCVWDTKTRRLTHWIQRLDDPARVLRFTNDGRHLVTAGDGPEARFWDVKGPEGEVAAPSWTFADPDASHITRLAIRPDAVNQLVMGHSDGRVSLWTWKDGQSRQVAKDLASGIFRSAVKALAFTTREDGVYLVAGGDSTALWFGKMDPTPRRINDFGAGPHHFEQVNALIAWPGTSIVVSGSDDTTVKFWDLGKRSLWGTFSAATKISTPEGRGDGNVPLDWVLFTPDGRFDSSDSVEGRSLVRFRHRDDPRSMEQYDVSITGLESADKPEPKDPLATSLYTFELTELLRKGQYPTVARNGAEPPLLALEPPTEADANQSEAVLNVTLGTLDARDLRLYQNGVPIAVAPARGETFAARKIPVRVKLTKGRNLFYAMASRAGAVDGRSREVELRYDGETEPGRIHVISLGVGDYARRKLNYARRDAERIGDVLRDRGLSAAGTPGMRIVLTDDQVTEKGITQAFGTLAKRVKKCPQDTVVVFLAGHTGVMDSRLFCLLLSTFPFPADAPLIVAARDAAPIPDKMKDVDRKKHLRPYYLVAQNLNRVDALQRLVIVDACQAEAILEDERVTAIQKWMEISSRPARTSYLMAARRGEPAMEAAPLGHGLLTFTLLRGMGAIGARDNVPEEITRLNLPDNADFDHNGDLTTGELSRYVDTALPPITRVFPRMVVASRAAGLTKDELANMEKNLDQKPRFQRTDISFRLFRLPDSQPKNVAAVPKPSRPREPGP